MKFPKKNIQNHENLLKIHWKSLKQIPCACHLRPEWTATMSQRQRRYRENLGVLNHGLHGLHDMYISLPSTIYISYIMENIHHEQTYIYKYSWYFVLYYLYIYICICTKYQEYASCTKICIMNHCDVHYMHNSNVHYVHNDVRNVHHVHHVHMYKYMCIYRNGPTCIHVYLISYATYSKPQLSST